MFCLLTAYFQKTNKPTTITSSSSLYKKQCCDINFKVNICFCLHKLVQNKNKQKLIGLQKQADN